MKRRSYPGRSRKGRSRRGRTLKVPPAHLGAWVAGEVARNVARRVGVRGAAATGAALAGAGGVSKYLGRKRKANGASSSASRRRVSYNASGEYGGRIKRNLRIGPQRRMGLHERRLQKISTCVRILRFQGVNPMNRGALPETLPGWFVMNNAAVSGTDTGRQCPIRIISLTNTINNGSSGAGPMFRLNVDDAGALSFLQEAGRAVNSISGTSTEFQVEYKDLSVNSDVGSRYVQPEWHDLRFLFYGAKNQPTVYDIMIVKFREDYLDPLENVGSTREASDRQSFWTGLIHPMMFNPIIPNDSGSYQRSKYNVIHRTRITIQPTLNTELDPTPASKQFNLFIKDGKVYDYKYHADTWVATAGPPALPQIDDALNTDFFAVDPNGPGFEDYSNQPAPRARVWMIIRALNTTPTNTPNANNTPSFDFVYRKKERMRSEN